MYMYIIMCVFQDVHAHIDLKGYPFISVYVHVILCMSMYMHIHVDVQCTCVFLPIIEGI